MSKIGACLLVPSVHELAKQPMTEVPERYLRPNQEPPIISSTTPLPQVPVIDLSILLSEDIMELEKLDHACKEWGFFQLINHGINLSLMENVKTGVQEFFNLPMEEKKQFLQTPGNPEGLGQFFVTSEDQKLEWADMFFIQTLPIYERNPHLFPCVPQPLRDDLGNLSLEVEKLFVTIIERIAGALKIDPNEMLEVFEDISQAMRWNQYPPCPQPENVIGLNPHSDAGPLTILFQVNEVDGLEIKKDGKWIPVKPLPNSFVVNIGDMLEIITNGVYMSVEHRATVNSEKERISIAAFHRPQMKRVIGPLPSLITDEKPALFKRIVVRDYYETFVSRELQGKSCLDAVRIQN